MSSAGFAYTSPSCNLCDFATLREEKRSPLGGCCAIACATL
ncbi:MAG TPA: hypothetical protein VK184_11275 [Nostocaceae cyanobacterium]|nr:hypothetical protein [Nostocaceae cyanobacterium]